MILHGANEGVVNFYFLDGILFVDNIFMSGSRVVVAKVLINVYGDAWDVALT